ncbi:hypothetical protein ACOKGD_09745 [Microbacterium phosphatis]|uniref:hypothetical protein n=1 Tax=Microbacterium phosphatis TaxID=3140248 RepID=UPI0031402C70
MPPITKITTPMVALALGVMTLAGCSAATEPQAAEQAPQASPAAAAAATEPVAGATPTPHPDEPETCARLSEVISYTDDWHLERRQPLIDLGAREFAQGEVTFDELGAPRRTPSSPATSRP